MASEKESLENEGKHIGLRRVVGNLHSRENEITLGTDIESNPFPFTEEEKERYEKVQLENTSRNTL